MGTGMWFQWPVPVRSRGWKTRQLPSTTRILFLDWAGLTCSPKSSGPCSALLAMLRLHDLQLNYQHFPELFRWSAAQQISWPDEIWDYVKITQTLIVYCKTAEVPRMGPGKRVMGLEWLVSTQFSSYQRTWDSRRGSGFLVGLPEMGLQLLLYCQYMTYTVTCLCVCHLPEIQYDVTSRATTVGG